MRNIIIMGMDFPGLFLLREFAKKSFNVYCVGRTDDDIGMYSRFGKKYVTTSTTEIVEIIQNIANGDGKRPLMFFGSGLYLDLVLEKIPEVFQYVDIPGRNINIMKLLNTKSRVYKKLKDAGINVPETYLLKDISKNCKIQFPVIVKWNTKKLYDESIGKTKLITDARHLGNFYDTVDKGYLGEHIIIQEYISEKSFVEWGYGAYYESGIEVGGIVFWLKRQYPQGISSCAVEIEDKNTEIVRGELKDFLLNIKYSGFVEIDFLMDPITGKYYVLDVNPRPWGCIELFGKKYINIVDYITGNHNNLEECQNIKPLCFIRFFPDCMAVFRTLKKTKKITDYFSILREYFFTRLTIAELDIRDLKPVWGCFKKGVRILMNNSLQINKNKAN